MSGKKKAQFAKADPRRQSGDLRKFYKEEFQIRSCFMEWRNL